jgi:hypothetical protein
MPASDGAELYRLPLGEFTRARDELARRLRKEGRRDEADAVKSLRKPTLAAWAVNQLAHRRRGAVKQLLDTGRRLRDAQGTLLSGGDRDALKRASAEERKLVDGLTRDATAIAGEARTAAGGDLAERIRNTLHAAALDEETAAALRDGRLTREREAVGLFGTALPAGGRATKAPAGKGARGEKAPKAQPTDREALKVLAGARSAEQKARRNHARAAQVAERAERQLKEAQAKAEEARRRADAARAAVRDARRSEKEASKAAERAGRDVAAAERRLG